jgi:hypothetical protein
MKQQSMALHANTRREWPLRLAAAACATLLSLGCSSQAEQDELANRQSESVSQAPVSPPTSQAPAARPPISGSAALKPGGDMHASIERQAGTVEVRIDSTEPFSFGALPPVLVIGDKAFGRSKHPPDGSPNVLIFMLDAAEYAALPAGAEMSVGYLSSSARLAPGKPASRSAPATGPRIQPNQVQANRRRLGTLADGGLEVLP